MRNKRPRAALWRSYSLPIRNLEKRWDRMPDEVLAPEPLVEAAEAQASPQAEESAHESGTTLSEYLESLLVTVTLALFGTTFVVQAFKIPSPSMENTLLVG